MWDEEMYEIRLMEGVYKRRLSNVAATLQTQGEDLAEVRRRTDALKVEQEVLKVEHQQLVSHTNDLLTGETEMELITKSAAQSKLYDYLEKRATPGEAPGDTLLRLSKAGDETVAAAYDLYDGAPTDGRSPISKSVAAGALEGYVSMCKRADETMEQTMLRLVRSADPGLTAFYEAHSVAKDDPATAVEDDEDENEKDEMVAEIGKRARQIMKSDFSVTPEQAHRRALQENPDLYEKYALRQAARQKAS